MKLDPPAIIAIMMAVMVILTSFFAKRAKSDELQAHEAAEKHGLDSFMQEELKQAAGTKNFYMELLRLLCTDDKEASSLLAFFRHNVDFITADGKILNPVQTVLFASPSAQNDSYMLNGKVRVFPSTAAERRRSGLAYHAEWEYHSGRKILTIPSRVGREYTRVWAGALFFHELRHAYDQVTGIEKKSTSGSVEFLMGELRAYTLEINLLDRETAGAFSRKTAEIASSHDKQGWIMIDFAMSRRLDQVFAPAKSENERIMRDGLFFVALNFQVSNNKKLGEKGKIDFLRSIYNTHEHRQ